MTDITRVFDAIDRQFGSLSYDERLQLDNPERWRLIKDETD